MEIKNFIKIYDDVLPLTAIATLVKWGSKASFQDAGIISSDEGCINGVQKNVRNTKAISLNNKSSSLTNVHYCMLVGRTCMDGIQKYVKDLNIHDFQVNGINDIQLLKYETGGFYTWHIDHAGEIIPRTMSCILFLNDDYKGGELIFRDPNGENEMAIKPKSSRLIIWPSSFMYPHTVKPVTEGTRYSVVAWAV